MHRLTAVLLGLGFSDSALVTGIYRRLRFQNQSSRWAQLALVPLKPWRAVRRCAAYVRQHHAGLRAIHGVGPLRQFCSLLWADLRHGIEPGPFVSCYALAVQGRGKWAGYLTTRQVNTLLRPLAERCDEPLRAELGDKRTFPAWARRHDLPSVPLIAVFEDGRVTWSDEAALPSVDLFAKPADYFGGYGAQRWRRTSDGWRDGADELRNPAQIVEHLRHVSQERPFILQRCLAPHPALSPFTTLAVPTIRAVTGLDGGGQARLLRASVRLPMPNAIVDNVTAGGMVAAINLDSGQLQDGLCWRPDELVQYTSVHPPTGAAVTGFALPEWNAVVALTERAQQAASSLPLIGWDVALTFEGPLLLEANFAFAPDIVTVPQRVPMGESGFCGILVRGWLGREV